MNTRIAPRTANFIKDQLRKAAAFYRDEAEHSREIGDLGMSNWYANRGLQIAELERQLGSRITFGDVDEIGTYIQTIAEDHEYDVIDEEQRGTLRREIYGGEKLIGKHHASNKLGLGSGYSRCRDWIEGDVDRIIARYREIGTVRPFNRKGTSKLR